MIAKFVEAFFRHAALIMLPIVVVPLDVTAWVLSTPPQYEAQAGVWVERPTYLNYSEDDISRYLAPAVVQRNRLLEQMRTRSFINAVISATSLANTLRGAGSDEVVDQMFSGGFDVAQNGDHLLVIRFRDEDQHVASEVLVAVVSEFRTRAYEDRLVQAQLAISFYQGRVTDFDAGLTEARAALAKYVASNAAVSAALSKGGVDLARLDPGFAEGQRRVDLAQRESDQARTSLAAAQLDIAAGQQSQNLWFRVIDPPGVSATPSRQLKKVLVFPLVALAAGLLLAGGMLLLFALSDHSVRTLADLAPEAMILGVLPRLEPENVSRRAGPHKTRRAVAFVAGTALPLRRGKHAL